MNYNYKEIVPYLLDWYDLNKRILPWRDQKNPYYTWVSEIMLQQTRVEAVKVYFERFITELPTIQALAAVEETRLLKLWEGLGYYNRVKNMQKAAVILVQEYNGNMPADYEALLKLPGIGSYTAGAISSIAFSIPVPAVDGNVLRVTKRIAASFDDITKPKVKKELEDDLKEIMPDRPGDFNQSLMELGATVCIPNGKPLCDKCPVMHLCNAFQTGKELMLPVKPKKKPRKVEDKTILIFTKDNKYTIRKRPDKGLLPGLWEFLSLDGHYSTLKLEDELVSRGIHGARVTSLGEAVHIFSHVEWNMKGYMVQLDSKYQNEVLTYENREEDEFLHDSSQPEEMETRILKENMPPFNSLENELFSDCIWVSKEEMNEIYALPSAFSAYKNVI